MKIKDKFVNPWKNEKIGLGRSDQYFGFEDGKVGWYDKYYRYNRKDQGKAYDEGIKEAIKQGATIEHYIEEPEEVKLDDFSVKEFINSLDELDFYTYIKKYNPKYLQSAPYIHDVVDVFLENDENKVYFDKDTHDDLDNNDIADIMTDRYLKKSYRDDKDEDFTNFIIDKWKDRAAIDTQYRRWLKENYDLTGDSKKKVKDYKDIETEIDKKIDKLNLKDFKEFLKKFPEEDYFNSKQYADDILYDFLYDEKNQRKYLKEDLDNDEQVVQYMTDKYYDKDIKFTDYIVDKWKFHYTDDPKYRKFIKEKLGYLSSLDSKKKLIFKEGS